MKSIARTQYKTWDDYSDTHEPQTLNRKEEANIFGGGGQHCRGVKCGGGGRRPPFKQQRCKPNSRC